MLLKFLIILGFSAFVVIYFVFFNTGILANISTEYTAGFNQEKYSSIQKGVNRQEVLDILGKPFSEAHPGLNCDSFSRVKSRGIPNLSDLLGWKAVNVCYDEKGNVTDKLETVFFN